MKFEFLIIDVGAHRSTEQNDRAALVGAIIYNCLTYLLLPLLLLLFIKQGAHFSTNIWLFFLIEAISGLHMLHLN